MLFRIAFKVAMYIIALILLVTGIGFFIGTFYLYLAALFHNPVIGAFLVGLTILLLAVLLMLIATFVRIRKKNSHHHPTLNNGLNVQNLLEQYPYRSALAALAVGFVAGFSPKIRDTLIDSVSTYANGGSLGDCLRKFKSLSEKDDEND